MSDIDMRPITRQHGLTAKLATEKLEKNGYAAFIPKKDARYKHDRWFSLLVSIRSVPEQGAFLIQALEDLSFSFS